MGPTRQPKPLIPVPSAGLTPNTRGGHPPKKAYHTTPPKFQTSARLDGPTNQTPMTSQPVPPKGATTSLPISGSLNDLKDLDSFFRDEAKMTRLNWCARNPKKQWDWLAWSPPGEL
jgi:hypothetical protein